MAIIQPVANHTAFVVNGVSPHSSVSTGSVIVFGQVSPILGNNSGNQPDRAWLGKYTLASGATVASISMLSGTSSGATGQPWKALLFSDSAGAPGTLLGSGAATNQAGASTVSTSMLSSPVVLTAGDYWIGMVSNDTSYTTTVDGGGGVFGTTRSCLLSSYSYASPPGTAPAPSSTYQSLMSFAANS
jgi:hypothetical protein